jgi:NDP-sugar pyrophosphorylase family protein
MERSRLTITLKKEILDLVDRLVDGTKIRNRSHAIEYLLSKNFFSEQTKVVILTGGEGIKMRPLTYEMPKALLPLHDEPILQHTIEFLAKNGFRDIVISVGYLGNKIKEYFKDGSSFGIKITYIEQKEQENGTAQPLLALRGIVKESPFILWYGDVLADVDLIDMLNFHRAGKSLVTMGVTSVEKSSDWGVVGLKGTRVVDFTERPGKVFNTSHLINTGIYVMEPEILNHIQESSKSLEVDIFPTLAREGSLAGYSLYGQWFDVGSLSNYEMAVKEWKR